MIVSVPETKAHLGIAGEVDDVDLDRLIRVAVDYLGEIGVNVEDPAPEPVRQAVMLLVRQLRHIGGADLHVRSEEVPGVASYAYHMPAAVIAATKGAIDMLVAPYRQVAA